MNIQTIIEERLREAIRIVSLQIIDDSAKHHGHAEALKSGGGHFSVIIISDDFEGKNLIERHRMVNYALKDLIPSAIHALQITAKTQKEKTKS